MRTKFWIVDSNAWQSAHCCISHWWPPRRLFCLIFVMRCCVHSCITHLYRNLAHKKRIIIKTVPQTRSTERNSWRGYTGTVYYIIHLGDVYTIPPISPLRLENMHEKCKRNNKIMRKLLCILYLLPRLLTITLRYVYYRLFNSDAVAAPA